MTMFRFVDLSACYWTDPDDHGAPVCAFLDTAIDAFIKSDTGSFVYTCDDDIPSGGSYGERMRALVLPGFWDGAPNNSNTVLVSDLLIALGLEQGDGSEALIAVCDMATDLDRERIARDSALEQLAEVANALHDEGEEVFDDGSPVDMTKLVVAMRRRMVRTAHDQMMQAIEAREERDEARRMCVEAAGYVLPHSPTIDRYRAALPQPFVPWAERVAAPRPADPLHPLGRCTCGGEGRCEWCMDHSPTT